MLDNPSRTCVRRAPRRGLFWHCVRRALQIAKGFQLHHLVIGHFPSDGWGWHWVGDPDRGASPRQTGGWAYNILPYIEADAVHALGTDGDPDAISQVQLTGAAYASQLPQAWFTCPSLKPQTFYLRGKWQYRNAAHGDVSPRLDYVANWGDSEIMKGMHFKVDLSVLRRLVGQFTPRTDESFSAWLRKIAEHRARDAARYLKREKRGGDRRQARRHVSPDESSLADLVELLSAGSHTPSHSVARHEAVAAVQESIDALPDDYRQAIQLRLLSGKSLSETAAIMDRSPRAVQGLVDRAKKKMRAALGRLSLFE